MGWIWMGYQWIGAKPPTSPAPPPPGSRSELLRAMTRRSTALRFFIRELTQEFGWSTHDLLTKLEKAKRDAKSSSEYADSAVRSCNETLRELREVEAERDDLRETLAAMEPEKVAAAREAVKKAELKPLPCIICGMQPDPAFDERGGSRQPYAATIFNAGSGHYGSTVWDEMTSSRTLEINVCDACLVERKDRVSMVVETVRQQSEYEYQTWRNED